ncbi:MAG: sulfite exporter TauE/SafE family protein [Patescibacteria group bacterium]
MKRKTLYIKGMHCPSCNILVEDKCRELKNVKDVKADFKNQTAEITYKGSFNNEALNSKIRQYGYQITDPSSLETSKESFASRLSQSSAIFIIFLIVFFFGQELNLIPNFDTSAGLSLSFVFILGLVASTSTCMATSGALFLSTIGKQRSFISAISFNIGRVLSYGFFGFVLGFLGKSVAQNFQLGPILMVFVAVSMVIIGLDMMQLVSLHNLFNIGLTKNIFRRLEKSLIKNPKKTALFLGAITYLLPCGFTQSVQLYAIGQADPLKSALIMMVFALGTTPALLAIGAASSITKSSYYPLFSRAMGVLIFMIGMSYATNTISLFGVNIGIVSKPNSDIKNVLIKDGVQVATMNVDSYGYSPSSFTIKKDVPVRWIVNGKNVFGCQGSLQVPAIPLQKTLATGENIIEFTPKEKGLIAFSCSMGMFRGNFLVI